MLTLTQITPKWLTAPATIATGLEGSLGPTLFRSLAKVYGLDPRLTKIGNGILQIFHYSMDILDGVAGHDYTANKAHLHQIFGQDRASVWSLAFAVEVNRYVVEQFGSDDTQLAYKVRRLFTRVVMHRLWGQYEELSAEEYGAAGVVAVGAVNYAKIAKLKTVYSSVAFPVALFMLLSSQKLGLALDVLHDEDLLEFGYWFHAETDFRNEFELSRPANLAKTHWSVFMDLVSRELSRGGEYRFPKTPTAVHEILHENDVFYKYVVLRENYLKTVEAQLKTTIMVSGDGGGALTAKDLVAHAQKVAVQFFRSQHQLNAYAMKLPDMSAIELHPQSVEINKKFHAWARQFPSYSIVYQFAFQYDFNEWLNYSYPFIESVDIMVELHKLCVFYVSMDDLMERSVHLIKDIEPILEDCSQPGFLEGKVTHRPIVWSDPSWPLLPTIEFLFRNLIQLTTRIQQPDMLGDFKLFKKALMWQRAIRSIRELVGSGKPILVEEYNRIRANESELFIWCGFGAAYYGKDFMTDFPMAYLQDWCFASFLQNELVSYGTDVILNKALPRSQRQKTLLSTVDNYRLFVYPEESIQDVLFRLNAEEERIVNWLLSFKGSDLWHMSLVFFGFAYHTLADRYSRSACKSKNTAICLMD